jgi:hypothetical protein
MKRYWRVGSEWLLPPARFPEPEPQPSSGDAILQENGDDLLQETGDRLLQE